jgi:hypothetical protein
VRTDSKKDRWIVEFGSKTPARMVPVLVLGSELDGSRARTKDDDEDDWGGAGSYSSSASMASGPRPRCRALEDDDRSSPWGYAPAREDDWGSRTVDPGARTNRGYDPIAAVNTSSTPTTSPMESLTGT